MKISYLNSLMRYTNLKALMDEELPSKTNQRLKKYRPDMEEVRAIYRLINREVFYGRLPMPEFKIKRLYDVVGMCEGRDGPIRKTKSHCTIYIADRYYCRQWFVSTLAHEMVHQYQWDVYSNIRVKKGGKRHMSHGPSFYVWRKKLARFGIALKANALHENKWFETQDTSLC